jgi:NAD(P)H dehydrogenase (quinone)
MNVLIVYSHPNPKSFNHALLEVVQSGLSSAGHTVQVRDLYAAPMKTALDIIDFSLISQGEVPPDVEQEQKLLSWAEGLVFIYPIWWFGPPAALKGWIDRVFLGGFAYRVSADGIDGLLKHQKALVLNTTGGPEASYVASNSKEIIVRPFTDGTLKFSGIRNIHVETFFAVPYVTTEIREEMLRKARVLAQDF